jgi:uncharacterized protein YhfF
MTTSAAVASFWAAFRATLPPETRPPAEGYAAWGFGDGGAMADELGALVVAGVKTATASLLWEYEHDGDSLPQVGQYDMVLDGSEQPLCVIQVTEVLICPFEEVEARFAYDEGEGDRSLRYWREVHWDFFSRLCQQIGRAPSLTMPIVGERFKVVYQP